MPVCQLWGIYHYSKIGKLEKVTKQRVVSFGSLILLKVSNGG